jgi:hypothetical protein
MWNQNQNPDKYFCERSDYYWRLTRSQQLVPVWVSKKWTWNWVKSSESKPEPDFFLWRTGPGTGVQKEVGPSYRVYYYYYYHRHHHHYYSINTFERVLLLGAPLQCYLHSIMKISVLQKWKQRAVKFLGCSWFGIWWVHSQGFWLTYYS